MSECLNCKVYVEVKISLTLDTLTAEPYKDAYSPTLPLVSLSRNSNENGDAHVALFENPKNPNLQPDIS